MGDTHAITGAMLLILDTFDHLDNYLISNLANAVTQENGTLNGLLTQMHHSAPQASLMPSLLTSNHSLPCSSSLLKNRQHLPLLSHGYYQTLNKRGYCWTHRYQVEKNTTATPATTNKGCKISTTRTNIMGEEEAC